MPAFAVPIDAKWPPDKLSAFCTSQGFTYAANADGSGSCTNPDCVSGKPCVVTCTADGACDAASPGIVISSMNLLQVLRNLYNPFFDKPEDFTKQKQSDDAPVCCSGAG